MAIILRQSTALDVLIGPFVDEDDGKTAETGLTLSQADINLSKNGQTLAQKNDDTTATNDANGYYKCKLNATDTNTVGAMTLICHKAGALPVRHEFQVVEEAVYDALFAASASGYAVTGAEMTLTAAYDAAKTAATQESVDDLPTKGDLATALAGADDVVLAALSGVGGKIDVLDGIADAVKATTDKLDSMIEEV